MGEDETRDIQSMTEDEPLMNKKNEDQQGVLVKGRAWCDVSEDWVVKYTHSPEDRGHRHLEPCFAALVKHLIRALTSSPIFDTDEGCH